MHVTNTLGKATKSGSQMKVAKFANKKAYRESFGFKVNDKGKTVCKMGSAEANRQWVILLKSEDNPLNAKGRGLTNNNPVIATRIAASGRQATITVALAPMLKTTAARGSKVSILEATVARLEAQIKAMTVVPIDGVNIEADGVAA